MTRLTTHVLDTANGTPASGVDVRLYAIGEERAQLASTCTNDDGRTDEPLLSGAKFATGTYEIEFDIGAYFAANNGNVGNPPFLGTVVIRVNLETGQHYHVPLLASPWAYSTYRGS